MAAAAGDFFGNGGVGKNDSRRHEVDPIVSVPILENESRLVDAGQPAGVKDVGIGGRWRRSDGKGQGQADEAGTYSSRRG